MYTIGEDEMRGGTAMRKTVALLLAALLLLAVAGCEAQPKSLSRTDYLLDTVVTLTLYGATEKDLDAAFQEIRRLSDLLDAYAPFSDLGWVQAAAGVKPVTVSADTMELLRFAKEMYERTGGYLDVTVGPLIDLWDIRNGGHYPTDGELSAALGLLGMDDLVLDEAAGTAYLARPGMRLDLGALAKGYIADKVKELLLSRGVESGVIDLGRNILLIGKKPGDTPFSIGVQSPMNSGELLRVLALKDQSLVTSGTYERYFDHDGRRYHHVLDPFTGFPADRGLLGVTVLSGSSLWGDALSTACLLLGEEAGLKLIDSLPEAEALFVRTDGTVVTSPGFPDK